MSTTKLPCGCKYDERAWLEECAEHKAESDERHSRAQRDYSAQLAGIVTPWSADDIDDLL